MNASSLEVRVLRSNKTIDAGVMSAGLCLPTFHRSLLS
jgi:hypothetical protein